MSDGSNSELESYSNEIARLVKLLATREATFRFLLDSAKEGERLARADEKTAEAKEYAWRDKCDRQAVLLREAIPAVQRTIEYMTRMLTSPWLEDDDETLLKLKIKRAEFEALKENIEKELGHDEVQLQLPPQEGKRVQRESGGVQNEGGAKG